MIITRQNPNGGPALRGFPIEEDPDSGVLGFKLGYVQCECGKHKTLLIRTTDIRQVIQKFGFSIDEYDTALFKLKKKRPWRHRIVELFGGKIDE